jgi:transposase
MRIAPKITLKDQDRTTLKSWSRSQKLPHRVVLRSKIILNAADGMLNEDIAAMLSISRPTVQLWRARFIAQGLNGITKDKTRPGRTPKITANKEKAIVNATLYTTPPNATHWSVRSMAKAQQVSRMTIHRIWQKHRLQPHRIENFKLSKDPHFLEKLHDVVGLYMNPPDKAIVFSMDEKSQIQALERSRPMLPLGPGIPAKQTHDYKRHGTTTLFAALNVLEGTLIGKCMKQHRHQEFIKFLNLINSQTPKELAIHIIVDNYGTHKHPKVKSWLGRHKRFHFHFIPTSSSWLNLIERWFGELTQKRLRRSSFENVWQLIDAINEFVSQSNTAPTKFIWTAPAERILAKIAKCKQPLGTAH